MNQPKIPQMTQNFFQSPKVWDFDEKRLHWASVANDSTQTYDGKISNENPKMATSCTLETQCAICHQIFSFS